MRGLVSELASKSRILKPSLCSLDGRLGLAYPIQDSKALLVITRGFSSDSGDNNEKAFGKVLKL